MESKYLKEMYQNRIEEGDYCVIYEQEQWDGFSNNLDLLNFMKSKGWKFISSSKTVFPLETFPNKCLAKRTCIELIFEKKI